MDEQKLNKLLRASVLAAIVLLGLAVRLRGHQTMSMWYDEGFSMVLIEKPWPEMMHVIRTDDHPPLYYYLLRAWMNLAPQGSDLHVAWARLLSILFGLATITATYLLAAGLFREQSSALRLGALNEAANTSPPPAKASWASVFPRHVRIGLIASFFTALAPFMVHYSHELRMYALLGLLSALAYWIVWRLRERWDWRLAMVWSALATGMMYTHYYSLAAVSGMFFCLGAWRWQQTRQWGKTLVTLGLLGGAVFLVYWHWLFWFFVQVQNNTSEGVHAFSGSLPLHQQLAYFADPFLGRFPQVPGEGLYQPFTGYPFPLTPGKKILLFAIMVLALFGKTLWTLRRQRPLLVFLACCLAYPLLLTLFYQYGLHGRFFGRLLILYWALFFTIIAYGAQSFRRPWINICAVLLIGAFFASSVKLYGEQDERSVTRFVHHDILTQHPDLPVYHTEAWSLLPLMARERMNPRHHYLVHDESSYISQVVAGRERLISPGRAATEISYPCLLVVFKEIYLNDHVEREQAKFETSQKFLKLFFPVGIQAQSIYNIGRRKWCQVFLIERPPPAANDR